MRAVAHARYSTDNQDDNSIAYKGNFGEVCRIY
jgi:hypothetical protein